METSNARILSFSLIFILAALCPFGFPARGLAQAAPAYKVGDTVDVDPQLTRQWSEGTITAVTAYGGKIYGYVVRVNSGPTGAGNSLRLSPAHFRPSTSNPGTPNSAPRQGWNDRIFPCW